MRNGSEVTTEMDIITVKEIVEATGGNLLCGDPAREIRGVSTDSRTVGTEDLFVPLIGEVHDAHKFLGQVIERGCRVIVLSDETALPEGRGDLNAVLVPDTLKALQNLSKYYLDKIGVRRVAVTGSVGKTTTRDMIYYICSEKFVTGRPQKNYNNTVGVPLTIFTFDSSMEVAVFEEGMDHAGMIHEVTEITRPEVAVITNIGISHMEHLGSRENIRKAKMEITDFFGPDNVLVINQSNDMLDKAEIRGPYRVVTAGADGGEDYSVHGIAENGEKGIEFMLDHDGRSYEIALGVPGAHNAVNAALAVAAGVELGVSVEEAVEGLKKLSITGKRLNIRHGNGFTVIDDSYNAAPESMKSAIRTLMSAESGRKIAMLAGMNELGEQSESYHEEVGRFAAESGVTLVAGVGEKAADIVKGAEEAGGNAAWFGSNEELFEALPELLEKGDTVLVKGSNAMRMDLVADRIVGENEVK